MMNSIEELILSNIFCSIAWIIFI